MTPTYFESLLLEDGFCQKLRRHLDGRSSARQRGVAECVNCGRCCWTGPCVLTKEDIDRLAVHLGLTPGEVFKRYLVVDIRPGGLRAPMLIRAEWAGLVGGYLPAQSTYDCDTPCIFRDDAANRCAVYDAIPLIGRDYRCWETGRDCREPDLRWSREDLMVLGWDGNEDEERGVAT